MIVNDDSCDDCNPAQSKGVWFQRAISTRLRELVSQDLANMFRFEVPNVLDIKYRIWLASDPATRSDAIYFWRAGVKWCERYHDALQPIEGGTIHLIGETFSLNQGWIEGAVETAEHLAQEVWGMAAPSWLGKEDLCKFMLFFVDSRSRRNKM